LKIWHQYDLATRIGNGHYYTFPFFEVDKLTPREIHHLNYSDFIFVASEWGKKILQQNNVNKPIYVAPLGVDASIFRIPENKILIENDNYRFFHIGKWEHRKSQDILLKAFDAAFDINDNVELYLLPFNPFLTEQENNYWFNLVENCKLKNKIKIFGRLDTQYQVAEFISRCDCGVFVSRAEGWNNEIIESMAMNKPVIVTNYSAHTEYCNKDNSYLVDIDETEPANDGKWFKGFGNWAKITDKQIEQIIHYMKYVYHNGIYSNPSGVATANHYSWNHTANIIKSTFIRNNSYYANTKAKTKRR
jgi:glycosyltransferase involved in cell wall biosynthesis